MDREIEQSDVMTPEEFTRHIDVLKNIRQGQDIGRFKYTKLELASLDVAIEFMEKSIE